MTNFLDYTYWFVIAYPIAGIIIILVSTTSTKPEKLFKIKKITEIINIALAVWLSFILISSLREAKENTENFFYRDTGELFWYLPPTAIIVSICFKKIRQLNFSVLLFSFILFISFLLLSSFFSLKAP